MTWVGLLLLLEPIQGLTPRPLSADTTVMRLSDAQIEARRRGRVQLVGRQASQCGGPLPSLALCPGPTFARVQRRARASQGPGWTYEALAALSGKSQEAVKYQVNRHRRKLRQQASMASNPGLMPQSESKKE